jgi:hypothetical protein
MRMLRISAAVAVAAMAWGSALGSEFDACVLQHMQGVTSDLAASSVKEACLRMVEKPLPAEALQVLNTARAGFGALPSYVGGMGLYISLNNNSGYTITELTIGVHDKKTGNVTSYVIRIFPFVPPPGVIAMGQPRDPTIQEMIAPGERQFYARISETARDPKKWNTEYSWSVAAAKGFPD